MTLRREKHRARNRRRRRRQEWAALPIEEQRAIVAGAARVLRSVEFGLFFGDTSL